MKLVEINAVCGKGSTGRIAVNVAEKVRETGGEAMVVYGRNTTDYQYAYKISSPLDNRVHGLLTRAFDMQGFGSKNATRKLISFLNRYEPDIVHLHLAHGYYLNVKMLFDYLRKKDIPLVWTMHDCWAFTGHCVYFDKVRCDRWKTGCHSCPQKKEYPSSYLVDGSKWNYRSKKKIFTSLSHVTIVSPSEWLAELIRNSFLKQYDIVVINNGIDLETFKKSPSDFRQRYNLEGRIILLGVADGYGTRKGFEDFIELSQKLDARFQIVMVGVEKEKLQQLPTNIIALERTSSVQELAGIYSEADIFLNLTYEDNFPTVNMESLACGTPVISYRTGGSPENLDETCSMIVEQHDIDGLLSAINTMTENHFCTEVCRKRAELYSLDKSYGQYVELFYNIYEEKNS